MLLVLYIRLDSDPDRRGRTSVCRRITPFLDQCEIREVDVCVFTVYRLGENAVTGVSHSVPVLGPDTALV